MEEDITSIAMVRRWFVRFMEKDTDFEDKLCSRCPLAIDDCVILDTVKEDPKVNTRSLATSRQSINSRRSPLGLRLQKSADSMDHIS